MPKMKVIWLCSFENDEVAQLAGFKSGTLCSPWINELISLFRNKNDINLSIIAPNYFNNKYQYFKLNNIDLHLFKYRPFFLPKRAYNLNYNFNLTQKSVGKIIERIKPDLIHLHGSENPLYSTGVIPLIKKYPVLVTIQGFICLSSKPSNFIKQYIRWNRIRIEKVINSKASFFTIASDDVLNTLNTFNSNAKIYRDHYPTTKPEILATDFPNKTYDIVYYARISKDKGIEDLLDALRIIRNSRPTIKAIIIGNGNETYIKYIQEKIIEFNLTENIAYVGFLPLQQDVYKLATQSRLYVLPTHFDGLPGSLREAMFMKLPVVAYAVGGIPSFNFEKECITLVEKRNIIELVEKIKLVLDDTERTNRLVENAYELITNKYDNNKIYKNILSIYNDILSIS